LFSAAKKRRQKKERPVAVIKIATGRKQKKEILVAAARIATTMKATENSLEKQQPLAVSTYQVPNVTVVRNKVTYIHK